MGRPPALGRACVGICLWAAGALAIAAEDPADIYKKILPAINLLLLGDRAIELTITSPVAGTGTTQSAVTVTGTVKGPAGLAIQATNTGAAGTFKGVVTGDPASSAGATYTVANVALGLGSNTITVTASHSSQSPVQKTVAVTRLALPTVQITSPVNGAIVEASPITVTGSFTSAASITVNGQPAVLNNPAPGQFTATGVTLTGSANGAPNTVIATAIQAEATATSSVSVTYVTDPRVEWVLEVPAASSYEVLARWVVIAGNSAAASYTVHHAGGSTTVIRDQQQRGGQWVSLGIFDLAPGANHRVELRPSAGGAVVADAVRIVSQTETIVHNIYADHLNTPRLITDQANQAVWRWDNDEPFGANAPNENPSGLGTFEFPLRLSNYYRDKETGIDYAMLRDCYDSAIGRFCQSDPVGLEGGINTYAYVGSNPLSASDPLGLHHPGVHWRYTYHSALESGLGIETSRQLADLTKGVDFEPDSQTPGQATRHGMCPPGTPLSKCFHDFDNYIERNLASCNPQGLASAIHAAQDRRAPGHAGGRTWRGLWRSILGNPLGAVEHFVQDFGPFWRYSTEGENLTNTTKEIIRRYKERCNQCGPSY